MIRKITLAATDKYVGGTIGKYIDETWQA